MKKSSLAGYLFLLVILVLAACTGASQVNLDTPPKTTSTPFTTQPSEEPFQEGAIETSSMESATPAIGSESGEQIPTVIPTDESTGCEDPFDGEDVRFSPAGWETNFCKHSVPYGEFLSGGPPRDGIPPIDEPLFEGVSTADDWLDDMEPVIALVVNEDARAYPLQILIWHEIVNDTVGNLPVVVTFCPLCNTALAFERPMIGDETLTFGTTGNLRNSDLVMWDRQTESWWQQFTGEALVGDLTGTQLTFLPSPIVSWTDFKEKYPDGEVLSRDTGYFRDYGRNPYAGYDNVNQSPFLFDGEMDDRLLPMTRVLGVILEGQGAAYTNDTLVENLLIQDVVGGQEIVVFWKAGTASAVDASLIPEGRDVGSTGVFLRTMGEEILTFEANGDGTFRDLETGSTWDILGVAIDGPLLGKTLQAVPHHDTFWFAWAAFVPEGAVTE